MKDVKMLSWGRRKYLEPIGTATIPASDRTGRHPKIDGSGACVVDSTIQLEANDAASGNGDSLCSGGRFGITRHFWRSNRLDGRVVLGPANCSNGCLTISNQSGPDICPTGVSMTVKSGILSRKI